MQSVTPGEHVLETLENQLSFFKKQWMNESSLKSFQNAVRKMSAFNTYIFLPYSIIRNFFHCCSKFIFCFNSRIRDCFISFSETSCLNQCIKFQSDKVSKFLRREEIKKILNEYYKEGENFFFFIINKILPYIHTSYITHIYSKMSRIPYFLTVFT